MDRHARSIYVLGDSHVRYFLRGRDHGLYAPRYMDGLEIGGATAADPLDHHMHYKRAAAAWAHRLNAVLDAIDPIAAPTRHWRFQQASFIKGFASHSADLPDELKASVRAGNVLIARHLSSFRNMGIITDARLDGQVLDPRIRMFPKNHAALC